ncbi:hypothetical protein OIU79_019188 [Salix purpurea]|uniref:MATH domain-containing protein n=1 Tax=Salix purpurea TaxID=77065 RepID=A0A9Q0P0L6_SALPP|nr:hypothetical protein OIU79_019188 [Salix purpurea]
MKNKKKLQAQHKKKSRHKKSSGEHGVTGTKRDLPPAHFSLEIESFSLLRNTEVEKYESDVFEAGGYKWRLCLYPNGKPKGNCFVSLYLKLEKTSTLRGEWEVNAEFKLFVYDHINKKYLTVQDKNHPVKRFHEMKTEWGFDQFLPLKHSKTLLKDTSSRTAVFLELREIKVYPGGYREEKGNSLSVYLGLADGDKLPPGKAIWAEYKLRVMDQRRDKHVEKTVRYWFTSSSFPYGFHKFMPLGDLHQVSKGYLLNDTLIVEAEFLTLSVSKSFP